MIVMNVKFNNVLSFYDFEVNFSYASKLKTSLIDGEYLKSKIENLTGIQKINTSKFKFWKRKKNVEE